MKHIIAKHNNKIWISNIEKSMLKSLFEWCFKAMSKSDHKIQDFLLISNRKKFARKITRRSLIQDALYYKTQEKSLDKNTRRVLYKSFYGNLKNIFWLFHYLTYRIHLGKKDHQCDECGQLFTQVHHLRRHRVQVHKKGKEKWSY